MEWMSNSEFLTYKILKYLNDNRNVNGISWTEILKSFQLFESTPFTAGFAENLVSTGLITPCGFSDDGIVRHFKITSLGEERCNLMIKQIEKLKLHEDVENRIKILTEERLKDDSRLFSKSTIRTLIGIIVGALLGWLLREYPKSNQTNIRHLQHHHDCKCSFNCNAHCTYPAQ